MKKVTVGSCVFPVLHPRFTPAIEKRGLLCASSTGRHHAGKREGPTMQERTWLSASTVFSLHWKTGKAWTGRTGAIWRGRGLVQPAPSLLAIFRRHFTQWRHLQRRVQPETAGPPPSPATLRVSSICSWAALSCSLGPQVVTLLQSAHNAQMSVPKSELRSSTIFINDLNEITHGKADESTAF